MSTLGPVGHDPVDAEVEQAGHGGLVVDGPDVHLQPGPVGGGHEASVDQRHPPLPERHLGRPEAAERRGRRASPAARGSRLAGRRELTAAGPIAVHRPGPRARRMRVSRRSEKDVTQTRSDGVGPAERLDQRARPTLSCLASMFQRISGQAASSSSRRGMGSVAVEADRGQLPPGHLPDQPVSVGDPVQVGVVEGQHHPVGGGVDIGLHVPVARVRGRG